MKLGKLLLPLAVAGCTDVLGADFDGYERRDTRAPSGASGAAIRVQHQAIDKVDLLFVVDNSFGMGAKQEILSASIETVLARIANPPCIDPSTGAPTTTQPSGPLQDCEQGSRQLAPITDIHVGTISTSLGGYGADQCSPALGSFFNETQNDRGRLLTRVDPGYDGLGFVAWDPEGKKSPPGLSDFEQLVSDVKSYVVGAGDRGCGFEAPLEAMYRFLVEPKPYETIERVPCNETDTSNGCAQPSGIDEVLLQQRAAFLRPDSLLAVVILSDENDCSVVTGGQSHVVMQGSVGSQLFFLPRATSVCDSDPNDPCCYSCAQATPSNCTDHDRESDPSCQMGSGFYSADEDNLNLRCFAQKRRFGIDFNYSIQRYINGFTQATILDADNENIPNPLFSNANDSGAAARDPSRLVIAGLVGVPWQDVATDAARAGGPLELLSPKQFRDRGRWDVVLGDPGAGVLPTDPFMIESVEPRTGSHPLTGAAVAPPSAGPFANDINGHERDTDNSGLQHACLTLLPEPINCDDEMATPDCPCGPGTEELLDPACQDPVSGEYGTTWFAAYAAPGTRQLQLLKGLEDNAVVSSICAPNLTDPSAADFGYQFAFDPIIARLSEELRDICLDRGVQPESNNSVRCSLIEATQSQGAPCNCTTAGRFKPDESTQADAERLLELNAQSDRDCLCEIEQLFGAELTQCQNESALPERAGWCYVSAGGADTDGSGSFARVGNEDLVASCGESKHLIRFTDAGEPAASSVAVLVCDDEVLDASLEAPGCSYPDCGGCSEVCEQCLCWRSGDRLSCENDGACSKDE